MTHFRVRRGHSGTEEVHGKQMLTYSLGAIATHNGESVAQHIMTKRPKGKGLYAAGPT